MSKIVGINALIKDHNVVAPCVCFNLKFCCAAKSRENHIAMN